MSMEPKSWSGEKIWATGDSKDKKDIWWTWNFNGESILHIQTVGNMIIARFVERNFRFMEVILRKVIQQKIVIIGFAGRVMMTSVICSTGNILCQSNSPQFIISLIEYYSYNSFWVIQDHTRRRDHVSHVDLGLMRLVDPFDDFLLVATWLNVMPGILQIHMANAI